MDNLAKKESRPSKYVSNYIPSKSPKLMDEGYEILRQGLIGHISRSPYQEYFFRNPKDQFTDENLNETKALG